MIIIIMNQNYCVKKNQKSKQKSGNHGNKKKKIKSSNSFPIPRGKKNYLSPLKSSCSSKGGTGRAYGTRRAAIRLERRNCRAAGVCGGLLTTVSVIVTSDTNSSYGGSSVTTAGGE